MSLRKSVAALAVLSLIASILTFFAQSASAAAPAWEPDPNANGTISFYNSSGTKVTSGTSLSHLFDYALASSAEDPNGFHKAFVQFAYPDHTKTDPIDWFANGGSLATTYPNASAPAPLNATGINPLVTVGSTEMNLTAAKGGATLDTTAGYVNIVQIRLLQSGGTNYWTADIQFDTVAGTWTQLYPVPAAGPITTTTTLGALPASPQLAGTNTVLTATVSPSGAAGTVQFKDGATNLATPVTVVAGQAQLAGLQFAVGSHSLTAVFTPTDAAAFTQSTSNTVTYQITSLATTTSTALQITPTTPITVGPTSTMTATITPSNAVGSVQFKDGATNIGTPVAVSGGTASKTNTFTVNTHSVTAQFIPTDSNAFAGSTSPAVSYVVNPAPATPTTTALGTITPASPQVFGTTLNFTGTVSPSNAVGTIEFRDGATVLASGNVSGGTVTGSTSTLGAGAHSITAVFVPTTPADFGSSSSAPASYTINQASTTTTLVASPVGTAQGGTSVTLTATMAPSSVPGAVQFMDGATPMGIPVIVAAGQATKSTTALSVGSHTISANFQPASANFSASSGQLAYGITKPPAGSTTTTLQVTPGGPVNEGTTETLTATLAPSGAAGTVQFMDGDSAIGAPVTLSAGTAATTTTLPAGTHSLKAVFTSADVSDFVNSESAVASYLVKPPATTPTVTLGATPASPSTFGTSVSLNATVSDSAVGSVTFKDGATTLGSSPVSSGAATLSVALGGGSHSLTAAFAPTDPTDFNPATSNTVSYQVDAVSTTTSLSVTPGPVAEGTSVTMTATVTPSAVAGSVEFKNGTTSLGSANVSGGTAVLQTATLPAGTASITATFTATTPANYATSTSAPVTIEVVAPPEFDSVTSNGSAIHDGDTLEPGQSLDLSASGFQPNEPVDVEVHSTVVKLATVNADADGKVVVTVTLPTSIDPGDHILTITGALGAVALNFTIAEPTTQEPPSGSGVSGSSGNLANTGFEVVGGVLIACLLAGAGVIALLLGTRRGRGLHRIG